MKNVLNSGGIIILFAEGGRTCFGEKFQFSPGGKKIRVLKNGVGWLALKTGATVLPVWVEGTDKVLPNSPDRRKLFCFPRFGGRITIKIGNPLRFQKGSQYLDKEQITSIIKNALLELADEE
jgi:1-acyl-sn-glycerol-3-phosphate acyltransferase